jgi:hypothetical protein
MFRRARIARDAALLVCAVSVACGSGAESGLGRSRASAGGAAGAGSSMSTGGAAAGGPAVIRCRSDKDCTSLGLLCDPVGLSCVVCVKPGDCSSGETCRAGLCNAKVPCTNSRDCVSASAGRLICDSSIGDCVQCVTALDCAVGQTCTGNVCSGAGGSGGAGGFAAGGASGPGGAGAGGFFVAGGSFGVGGSIDTGGSAGAGGGFGVGGSIDTGGVPGDGGFGGGPGNGGTGGGTAGAWGRCRADADCADQRVCTFAIQQVLGVGGMGACVKSCTGGSTATCDPAPAGTSSMMCAAELCSIVCGADLSCPAGFTCPTLYRYCFPTP